MEILSPAGSPEGLVASIKGGCDAVYLAGKAFGARAFAKNFDDKQLEGAVNYAHDNGVKVYVTMNTLIKDDEIRDALSFVRLLDDIDADAVIVQDLGIVPSIRRFDVPIHASTQMGIHSSSGLKWCKDNGIDRAILARELTFDEIKEVVRDSPVETEVFIQGAICYSISGGCLFSSMAGGRSGNRGQCAQPCRKKYKMGDNESYILSNSDLFAMDWMKRLESIGVNAVKIEGRMRSHAYAYLSTKVCSMVNSGDTEGLEEHETLLKTVFNRGYCDGYLPGEGSLVQYDFADNRGFLLGNVTITDKRMEFERLRDAIGMKDGLTIFNGDSKMGGFKVIDPKNLIVPFKIKDGEYQLYRTYDQRIDGIKNLIGDAPKLDGSTKRKSIQFTPREFKRNNVKRSELSFYVSGLKVLDSVMGCADRVYFDLNDDLPEAIEMCKRADVEIVANLPRLYPIGDVPDCESIMVHTPNQCDLTGKRGYGSHHMNMFNSQFSVPMHQMTLSTELSKQEIRFISQHYPGRLEVMMFGRTELMCTRDSNMDNGIMEDDKGFKFPVYKDSHGLSHILNSSDLLLLQYYDHLKGLGIESFGIDVRKRPVKLASLVAESFKKEEVSRKDEIADACKGINYGKWNTPLPDMNDIGRK